MERILLTFTLKFDFGLNLFHFLNLLILLNSKNKKWRLYENIFDDFASCFFKFVFTNRRHK